MEYKSVELEYQEIPYKDFTSYDAEAVAGKYRQVIEGEGPVVDDFLELKVLKSFGIFQRGSLIAPFMRSILLSTGAVITKQTDCDGQEHLVLWPSSYEGREADIEDFSCPTFSDYRPSGQREEMEEGTFRSIADFPQIEIFNAMKAVLSDGQSVKKPDLLTQTNHELGFLVKGRQIRETLEIVLKKGISNGTFVYNRRAGTIRLR